MSEVVWIQTLQKGYQMKDDNILLFYKKYINSWRTIMKKVVVYFSTIYKTDLMNFAILPRLYRVANQSGVILILGLRMANSARLI